MTLNLNNPDTILVFDTSVGLGTQNEAEIGEMQIDGCEYSGSNLGFDLQMNRRRLILLGSEGTRGSFMGTESDQSF